MTTAPKGRSVLLRVPSVTRITLNRELARQFERLNARSPGVLLDVGHKNSPYRDQLACGRYMTLDLNPAYEPDICCDLAEITWESDYFDAVVATEVLAHVSEPRKVVEEIRRILKPGGVCLLTARFIYHYHPDPADHYRYTWDSLRHLFRDYSRVEVIPHGNRLHVLWQVMSSSKLSLGLLSLLNPLIARVRFKNTDFPLGFVVWAEK